MIKNELAMPGSKAKLQGRQRSPLTTRCQACGSGLGEQARQLWTDLVERTKRGWSSRLTWLNFGKAGRTRDKERTEWQTSSQATGTDVGTRKEQYSPVEVACFTPTRPVWLSGCHPATRMRPSYSLYLGKESTVGCQAWKYFKELTRRKAQLYFQPRRT